MLTYTTVKCGVYGVGMLLLLDVLFEDVRTGWQEYNAAGTGLWGALRRKHTCAAASRVDWYCKLTGLTALFAMIIVTVAEPLLCRARKWKTNLISRTFSSHEGTQTVSIVKMAEEKTTQTKQAVMSLISTQTTLPAAVVEEVKVKECPACKARAQHGENWMDRCTQTIQEESNKTCSKCTSLINSEIAAKGHCSRSPTPVTITRLSRSKSRPKSPRRQVRNLQSPPRQQGLQLQSRESDDNMLVASSDSNIYESCVADSGRSRSQSPPSQSPPGDSATVRAAQKSLCKSPSADGFQQMAKWLMDANPYLYEMCLEEAQNAKAKSEENEDEEVVLGSLTAEQLQIQQRQYQHQQEVGYQQQFQQQQHQEQLREQQRQEQLREQQHQEQLREQQRQEQLREQQRQEQVREQQRQEQLREQQRQEQLREQQREDKLREQQIQERRRQEQLREQQRQEQQRSEQLKEQQRQEHLREQQRQEHLREQQRQEQQRQEQQRQEQKRQEQQRLEEKRQEWLIEQQRQEQLIEQQIQEELMKQQIQEQRRQQLEEQQLEEQQLEEQQLQEQHQEALQLQQDSAGVSRMKSVVLRKAETDRAVPAIIQRIKGLTVEPTEAQSAPALEGDNMQALTHSLHHNMQAAVSNTMAEGGNSNPMQDGHSATTVIEKKDAQLLAQSIAKTSRLGWRTDSQVTDSSHSGHKRSSSIVTSYKSGIVTPPPPRNNGMGESKASQSQESQSWAYDSQINVSQASKSQPSQNQASRSQPSQSQASKSQANQSQVSQSQPSQSQASKSQQNQSCNSKNQGTSQDWSIRRLPSDSQCSSSSESQFFDSQSSNESFDSQVAKNKISDSKEAKSQAGKSKAIESQANVTSKIPSTKSQATESQATESQTSESRAIESQTSQSRATESKANKSGDIESPPKRVLESPSKRDVESPPKRDDSPPKRDVKSLPKRDTESISNKTRDIEKPISRGSKSQTTENRINTIRNTGSQTNTTKMSKNLSTQEIEAINRLLDEALAEAHAREAESTASQRYTYEQMNLPYMNIYEADDEPEKNGVAFTAIKLGLRAASTYCALSDLVVFDRFYTPARSCLW